MERSEVEELCSAIKEHTFEGDVLLTVSKAANRLRTLDEDLEAQEIVRKYTQAERDMLDKVIIPGLLFLARMKNFELDDGAKVSYKETVYCSLPKEDMVARELALKWLNENGGSFIIKDQVTVESPTEELMQELTGRYRIERKKDVHAASLKSFMSELLGVKENSVARLSPDEVPQELHLYIENKTTIKEKRKQGDKDE